MVEKSFNLHSRSVLPPPQSKKIIRIEPDALNHSVLDLPQEIVEESCRLAGEQELDLNAFSKQWHAGNALIYQKKIKQSVDHIEQLNEQLIAMGEPPLYSGDECGDWESYRANHDGREAWDLFFRLKEDLIDRLVELDPKVRASLMIHSNCPKELQHVLEEAEETVFVEGALCGAPRIDFHHFDLPLWIVKRVSQEGTEVSKDGEKHYLPIEMFLGKKEGDCVTLYLDNKRIRLQCRQLNRVMCTGHYTCAFTAPFEDYLRIYEERARRLGFLDTRISVKGSMWRYLWRRLKTLWPMKEKDKAGLSIIGPRRL